MRKLFTVCFLVFYGFSSFAQDGIIGAGFTTGWNSGDALGFSSSFGTSRIITRNPSNTGNQYFRLMNNGGSSQYGPFNCVDTDWSSGVNNKYENMPICSGGAFYINCPNTTDNYIFKTPSVNDNRLEFD